MFPLVSLNVVNVINVTQFLKLTLMRNTFTRILITSCIHYTPNHDYNFFWDQIIHFFMTLLVSDRYIKIVSIRLFNVLANDDFLEASLLFTGFEIE